MDDGSRSPSPSLSPPSSPSPSMSPSPSPPIAVSRPSRQPPPVREDCWSEESTRTLIEAWGHRHLELNRGNLRQKHWQEVADAVNARHGHVRKARRTDAQCKNRIDTLKKKYKVERARVSESKGTLPSPWPFYDVLHRLIGSSASPQPLPPPPSKKKHSPLIHRKNTPVVHRKPTLPMLPPPPSSVPVAPRSKRPVPGSSADEPLFRRGFSAVAAAAAAIEAAGSGSGSESSKSSGGVERDRDRDREGYRDLARAIERFGEIYERVEEEKQIQMIELEKQRMQFAKDLEFQRMQLYVDTQVQLEKIKRAKRSDRADSRLASFLCSMSSPVSQHAAYLP